MLLIRFCKWVVNCSKVISSRPGPAGSVCDDPVAFDFEVVIRPGASEGSISKLVLGGVEGRLGEAVSAG